MDLLPKDTDPILQQKLKEISDKAVTPVVKHYTAAPLINQVAQGSHVTADVAGVKYFYVNIGGALFKVALTAA